VLHLLSIPAVASLAIGFVLFGSSDTWRALYDPAFAGATGAVAGAGLALALATARAMNLTPTGAKATTQENNPFRRIITRGFGLVSFLREPSGLMSAPRPMPRQLMLSRFAALMDHVAAGGLQGVGYDRVVIFAHGQGSVLATTLLAEQDGYALPPRVALLTCGCPLLTLYARRLPEQFSWTHQLSEGSDGDVNHVNEQWLNLIARQDMFGSALFGGRPAAPGSFPRADRQVGDGGHLSYWKNGEVYGALQELIEAPLE
jgi:hypothetical protein